MQTQTHISWSITVNFTNNKLLFVHLFDWLASRQKTLKYKTGRVIFCWFAIQNAMPYTQKYTPSHCFLGNYAGWAGFGIHTILYCFIKGWRRGKIWNNFSISTQPAHDVRTTFYRRYNDVKTLKQRRNNVVLTSCAGWVLEELFFYSSEAYLG